MKVENKKIIELVIIFLIVFLTSIAVHMTFLNLEYGLLRSFILGIGAVVCRYVYIKNKSQR